jgi:hypothetical protein
MHDSPGVTKCQSSNHLKEIGLDEHFIEQTVVILESLLEIPVEEFKHEIKLAIFLDAVFQIDNVFVGQLSQEGDFAEGRGGDALVFDFEADAFEGYDFVGLAIAGFVDYAVGSFA